LRVAAVIAAGTGNNGVYVTPHNAAGAPADRIDVRWRPGADRAAGEAAVRDAVLPTGATVSTRAAWLAATGAQTSRQTRVGYLVVLGLALVYAGIALANTAIMATSDRTRDLTVLRLTGATRRQVLAFVALETVAVVLVGTVLGLATTVLNLLGIGAALATLSVWSPIVVPWGTVAVTAGACAVIAVTAAAASRWRRGGDVSPASPR
jgi:putative ABC transport system permease protein